MNIRVISKSLRKNYLAKKGFIVRQQVKKLVTKNINVFNVQNKLEMKTMNDYYDLYLKCDVLMLADVFEKFKNNRLKNYGLCPSHHYLGKPALSWNTMANVA